MKTLHSAQDAIEQAIEGGWRPYWYGQYSYEFKKQYIVVKLGGGEIEFYQYETALTDPLFWQALGKARGWWQGEQWRYNEEDENENIVGGLYLFDWQYHAIEWMRNRMVGGDEQKFWESLP